MKVNKNGSVKYIDEARLEFYLSQGWTVEQEEPVKARLRPVKKTVMPEPAVEASVDVTLDSVEVVGDDDNNKGE
jgi:hypothetical protein